MPSRLQVSKTYKLFIDGKFPRSESGRTIAITDSRGRVAAHVCHASRKDLRDAVTAARKALPGWKNATAYLRGQILYRMAEMMEGKCDELAAALIAGGVKSPAARREVEASIDRLIAYAGWADKYAQVLGCNNAVAGPYYNFTVPEPTGVVAVIAPDSPGLLGLVSLCAPALCAGNAVVAVAGAPHGQPIAAAVLAEVFATSDLPGGVLNLLAGTRDELVPIIAGHRDIDAVLAAGVSPEHARTLREGAAENVKRVKIFDTLAPAKKGPKPRGKNSTPAAPQTAWFDAAACESPWWIEPVVEMKTIWHPSAA
ncbi:MAG: aldehyde dehydrogenase family protein [Phycisphaeraceae bacterium]|nr:aldehyde dehydrogenase family protein [Phycisphaeraceae bacterium]